MSNSEEKARRLLDVFKDPAGALRRNMKYSSFFAEATTCGLDGDNFNNALHNAKALGWIEVSERGIVSLTDVGFSVLRPIS